MEQKPSGTIPKPKFYSVGQAGSLTPSTRLRILKESSNLNERTPKITSIPSDQAKKTSGFQHDTLCDSTKRLRIANKGSLLYGENKASTPVRTTTSKQPVNTPRQLNGYESHLFDNGLDGSSQKKAQGLQSDQINTPVQHSTAKFISNQKRTTGSAVKQIKAEIKLLDTPVRQLSAVKEAMTPRGQTAYYDAHVQIGSGHKNGIDYTDMINRKAELKYSGPGYIVAFNCHPKYLASLVVSKGFWRVISDPNYTPSENCFDIGPQMYLHRLDVDQSKDTPSKKLSNVSNELDLHFIVDV